MAWRRIRSCGASPIRPPQSHRSRSKSGGVAFGFDRLCAIISGSEGIRDIIPFPKNNTGRDIMLDAPSEIDTSQLDELGLIKK